MVVLRNLRKNDRSVSPKDSEAIGHFEKCLLSYPDGTTEFTVYVDGSDYNWLSLKLSNPCSSILKQFGRRLLNKTMSETARQCF